MSFSKKAGQGSENSYQGYDENTTTPFVRDDSDNKLFKSIQIKDISSIITEDCVGAWDFDGVVYRVCSNMEHRLIKVKHKTEDIEEVLQNITTFKGRGKKISEVSWLGVQNIKREVEGKPLFNVDDFEITPFQELKMEKDKALEQAKIQIFMKIKQVKQQYGIPKVKLLLGEGSSFRESLNQAKLYKGNRADTLRPLLLKEVRQWVLDELDSEFAAPLDDGRVIECDDLSNFYGVLGYQNYVKTGKFNFIELSPDKDSPAQSGKLMVNPDTHTGENNPLRGKFKFPQAMLIHTTNKSIGDVELVVKGGEKSTSKEVKGYGLKFLVYQAILGKDQADSYNCLGDIGISLGDVEAYKLLKPCKTAKEVLQVAIDTAYERTPYGVQYTSHKGEKLDVDTMTYLNEYFRTAYMLRNTKDCMDLYKLCDAFKVDTSKVMDNNKLSEPVKVFVGDEDHLLEVQSVLKEVVEVDMKGLKSMTKVNQAKVIDTIKQKLEGIDFGSHYEMQQEIKAVPDNKPRKSLQEAISVYNKEHGYDDSPENCYEVFIECLSKEVVQEDTTSEHRWYDVREVVHKVIIDDEDRYFATFDYHITGDNCASDMDLDLPTLDDVYEVFPKKKEVIVYEC
ncbi:hypothetical protein VPHG_00200 [Vibrio phage 11895-B1]|uniref:hypothetical protein n=1 Tax=Vibrio phage 11895-B1 TaxID=754075 RepID=UPI0002C10D18|nr:hypothetical protein VPHG_00200 [Vibrio phage 11895-B1]AGH32263.1 hypothetical protein VPHG_00200 [Vibrio phage 11895-B1]